MAKTDSKSGDWFTELDEELEKKTIDIMKEVTEQSTHRSDLNRTLVEDFWKIWIRFNKINVHLTIEPEYSSFAHFDEFPNVWRMKEEFDFSALNHFSLTDRTQDQGRVGDSLKVWYYAVDTKIHIRMVFEYCEGEHYYKYAGWKRIFSQYVLYDAAADNVNMQKLHDILSDVVKTWYESHLRRERDIILKHLKDKYQKGETFTQ
ncbi:MAG: hypothetical protein OEV21_04600 [Thermoplasmata archaeon]|nr:hypothetical protein [Thermoplasmata archaeon]